MNYSQGGYYQPPENGGNSGGSFSQPPYGWNSGLKIPHFVPHEVWGREKIYIRKLSIMAASAVLLFIVGSGIFVAVFQGVFSLLSGIEGFDYNSFAAKWDSAEFQYMFETLYSVFIVGGPFFLLGLIFNKTGVTMSIPLGRPENPKYLPMVVLGAFGVCLAGNIITSYFDAIVEVVTGFGLEMPEMPETPHSVGGILLFYLSTAVVPALIEEMALRGVVMQPLRRYGDWFAIICSSLIFGLMHCNLMQIPFAFIAGVAIGYATIVTESVWTGVLIHFLNNAFAVTVSIVDDFYGMESVQYIIVNTVFYVLIAAGLMCAFFYVKKIQKKTFKKSPLVNTGKNFAGYVPQFSARISNGTLFKTYLVTVPMIIAFIAVVYETVAVMLIM